MYKDEIIEEVWKNRQAYARRRGNSLGRMVADLQRRQQKPLSDSSIGGKPRRARQSAAVRLMMN